MSFIRLLELWAELEPDRCSYASGIIVLRGWSLSYDSELEDRLTLGEIQCAIQDAIEHRGWNWNLGRFLLDDIVFFRAHISIPHLEYRLHNPIENFISTHSPTYALLEAYLHLVITYNSEYFTEDDLGDRSLW